MRSHQSLRQARWVAAEPDWDHVYTEQLPRVLSFFRYRLGGTADVEDLTAQTFEKAWSARHRYRSDVAGFATWLLTIARNVAIDHVRARQRPWPGDTLKQQAVQQSETHRLAVLLATLPPRQRELIAMTYGADMTNRAIARATGLSETNVETILHRAVASLRVCCEEHHMSKDAWLCALRAAPSPRFTGLLRARLRAPAADVMLGPTLEQARGRRSCAARADKPALRRRRRKGGYVLRRGR
jgi:RNA polymerase sigma-70 factor (ECF subfamily)